jgi:DNA-binding transcriptional LysR family regulator
MGEATPQDLTLRQLQIFWVVVHAGSLTRAAKQLEMRQPSISQQLSRMEHLLGGKLLRFVNNEMRLTPAGEFLRDEAGRILGAVDSVKAGLTEFFEGRRARFVVGALPSLARNLLVPAFARIAGAESRYVLDILEMMPGEAIEQLHGRTIDAALITGYAARVRLAHGLKPIVVGEDAQLLAVPRSVRDLSDIAAPERELPPAELAVLHATIRYAFGSEHTHRVNQWYDNLLPGSRMLARCRTFESALALVERGAGAAIVPELAAFQYGRPLFDVTLYALPVAKRQTIALVPDHYVTLQSLRGFLDAIREAAAEATAPVVAPPPRFALARLKAAAAAEPAPDRLSL